MPKLWTDTIERHRRAVREAVVERTAALVAEHGVRSVTMSRIAETVGIGRATLYKYFPDLESILLAWHERRVNEHLDQLGEARDQTEGPGERLRAVLEAYAAVARQTRDHHDGDLAAFLHDEERVAQAQSRLHILVRELVSDAVAAGVVRDDMGPDDLTSYCLNAVSAAADVSWTSGTEQLVSVILDGLSPKH